MVCSKPLRVRARLKRPDIRGIRISGAEHSQLSLAAHAGEDTHAPRWAPQRTVKRFVPNRCG